MLASLEAWPGMSGSSGSETALASPLNGSHFGSALGVAFAGFAAGFGAGGLGSVFGSVFGSGGDFFFASGAGDSEGEAGAFSAGSSFADELPAMGADDWDDFLSAVVEGSASGAAATSGVAASGCASG